METAKYSNVRQSIRSGDLLFFEPRPWPETPQYWFVRAVTGHRLVHVASALRLGRRAMLIESDVPDGVQVQALGARLPLVWLPLELAGWRSEQTEAALDLVGTPYGWEDAVRLYVGQPPALPGVTCCELVCQLLRAAGMQVGGLRTLLPEPLLAEVSARTGAVPVLLTA